MRILHLLASPYWSGPAETVALLAEAQRALGHEAAVAVDRKRSTAPAEELAVPRLAARGLLDEGGLELCVKSTPAGWWRDLRNLKARQVDVVHCHFTHDHQLARLSRPRSAVLVRSIHALRSLRWTLPAADAYTVPAAAWVGQLVGRRVGVLPAFVGPEYRPPEDLPGLRESLGLNGAPLVGMVSTFQRSRRHTLGLEAMVQLRRERPGAHLVLVGDGPEEAAIREQVRSLGLEGAVTFAGYRAEDFVSWLQALDVAWILGLGNDWSGRAAAQARACGVRVVAVDEGALADHADSVVPPEPAEVARATLEEERSAMPVHGPADAARRVLELYRESQGTR